MDRTLATLQASAGIHFIGATGLQLKDIAHNFLIAQDAQPELITTSNAGIPAFLSTLVDPKLIEVLVKPMMAAEIVGEEVKKGDWTTETAMFLMVESTGEVSSYGDYSENGRAGVNVNYPQRQSYHYQVMTEWGERELEKAGLAKIDWANRVGIASVNTLNLFQNKSYFFGVKGLENVGLLNDPNLIAPITPIPDTTVSGDPVQWSGKSALGVYADIQALFTQLVAQATGLVTLNMKSPMTLAMSPTSEVALTKTTEFNVNVSDLLKKNFPNMTVKSAVEYNTNSGELVQLIADELDGQRTAQCGFTEKLRAHPIVVKESSFRQKKSQGTWGTIIYRPFLIAQLLGV